MQKQQKIRQAKVDGVTKDWVLLGLIIAMIVGFWLGMGNSCPEIGPCPTCSVPAGIGSTLREFEGRVMEAAEQGKCNGVVKYYSGTGFAHDLEIMRVEYLEKASSESGNMIGSNTQLFPISSLALSVSGQDCEDFALWTYCLSSMYPNVDMMMYYSVLKDDDHIGFIIQAENQTFFV